MSQPPTNVFRTSCGATAPLELNISGPGCAAGERRIFEPPFVLIGRHERSDLHLEDGAVSRQHAYLQQFGGRVFCIDLGSRTGIHWGGEARLAGWLRPEQGVQIGPYTLELATTAGVGEGLVDRMAENWDPLQDRANDSQLLPRITVEVGNKVLSRLHMNRVLVLVGSSPACRIRLRNASVAKYHCSLVRTPQGVWLIDLLHGTGACLNGQFLRYALLKEGDRLQVGPYVLRVWYPDAHTETPHPDLMAIPAGTPMRPKEDTLESGQRPSQDQGDQGPPAIEAPVPVSTLQAEMDQARERQQDAESLRPQLADSQAECDRLRARVAELEDRANVADRLWPRFRVMGAETERLRVQLRAAESRQAELEPVRGECDRLREQARALEAQLSGMAGPQARLEAAEASTCELDAVRGERDRWQAEARNLQDRLDSDSAEREAWRQRLEAAQQQLVGEREALKQQLTDARPEHAQLLARVAELEDQANAADHLWSRLQDADAETERLRVQLRAAESCQAELESVMAGLQARLEATETSARELDVVHGERDRWQAGAQSLQASLPSDSADQEQLGRLTADLHAAQVERDRLQTEQQMTWHAVEQSRARVADLERALAEAAAHQTALEEARARWESERQALEVRLEWERQSHDGSVQGAIRDVQAQSATEREEWRQRLEAAQQQLVWERRLFQFQNEQNRQQAASLQVERDRLAARLAQVAMHLRTSEGPSPNEVGRVVEVQQLRQQAARDQVFVQLSRARLGNVLQQAGQPQNLTAPAEQARPRATLVRERASVEQQRPLIAVAHEVQAAWGDATACKELLPVIDDPPDRAGGEVSEVGLDSGGEKTVEQRPAPPTVAEDEGEASAPSDTPHGSDARFEGRQLAEDVPSCLPQQTDSRSEARQGVWRQIFGFVLGK